jgi:hypothetical protein
MELIKKISSDNFFELIKESKNGDEIILHKGHLYEYNAHNSGIVYTQDGENYLINDTLKTTKEDYHFLESIYNFEKKKLLIDSLEKEVRIDEIILYQGYFDRVEFDGKNLYIEKENKVFIKKNNEEEKMIYSGPSDRNKDRRWWWKLHPFGLLINLYDNNIYLIHILKKY